MYDYSDQDTDTRSSNHSDDGHHNHCKLDQLETEPPSSHRPLSPFSEYSEAGDNDKFQSIRTAFQEHTHADRSSAVVSPRPCINSPGVTSYQSSNLDSHDEHARPGLLLPSEASGQHGYERDTQAFENKRPNTTPLETHGEQVTRQGSMTSLTQYSSKRCRGTPVNTSGTVSEKGGVYTRSAPITPTCDLPKRYRTLSLEAKKSILDITVPGQDLTATTRQLYEAGDHPIDLLVGTPPEETPAEPHVHIEYGLRERELEVDSSSIKAFAVIESSQKTKVEELQKNVQISKVRLERTEQSILNLRAVTMQAADVTGTPDVQLSAVRLAQRAVQSEEQNVREEIGSLTSEIENITYALAEQKGELTAASKTVRILEAENKDIQCFISSYKPSLEDAEKEASFSVDADYELLKVETKHRREDIEAMQRALASNIQSVNAYKARLANSGNNPKELIVMRADVRTILGSNISFLADISAQSEALKVSLAKKQREIESLKEPSLARAAHLQSQDANNDYIEAADTWQSLYEDKKQDFDRLQHRHHAYRAKAEKRFRPGLERENNDLRTQCMQLEDDNARLRDQTSALQESSANWGSECKLLQSRTIRKEQEAEQEIERLTKEMTVYVQEYKDKTPEKSPEWWSITDLQHQVRDLERKLKAHVEFSDEQKHRLQTCYLEYTKMKELNEALKRELGVEETYVPSTPSRYAKLRVPNYETAAEVTKRAEILKEFREKQARLRAKRQEEQELIEQARRHKMGERYPPSHEKRYTRIMKKGVRERWEVDQFERMKVQGLIGESE
jgi:hypothetical protein